MEYNWVFHIQCDVVDVWPIVETGDDDRVSEWNRLGSFMEPVILWADCPVMKVISILE